MMVTEAEIKEVSKRLREYVRYNFSDNQSTFGHHIQQSQTIVNRVLNGEQLPSGKFLYAMLVYTNVNLKWLLTGVGEMIETTKPITGYVSFPLTSDKVNRMPPENSQRIYIPYPGMGSDSVYAYRVSGDENFVKWEHIDIKVGDLLLFETNPKLFPSGETTFSLYLISHPDSKELEFATVTFEDYLFAETFPNESREVYWEINIKAGINRPEIKVKSVEEWNKDGKRRKHEVLRDNVREPNTGFVRISRRNLVAHCIFLLRSLDNICPH